MTDLVTGGSGFLGAALCRELIGRGRSVRVLDDHSRGRPERLEGLGDAVELIDGDVRDAARVREAVQGAEVVWHLAAVNGTRHFYERPDVVLEVGIKGTLNVVEAMLEAGGGRLVLASSSEVYQHPDRVPTPEDERLLLPDPKNPRFSYSGSKIAGELLALQLGAPRGLDVVVVRPHNVYGPDMGFEHVIPELVGRLAGLGGVTPPGGATILPIQGTGQETRAFCHISDAARGFALAGLEGEPGSIFHLGTSEEVSIAELAGRIGRLMGLDLVLKSGPLRHGSTPRRCPDITRLAALGYAPQVSLEAGLGETVAWYAARVGEEA